MSDLLIVGIEGSMRTHPLPELDNFVVVPWEDKHTIERADVFIQANIKECKLKGLWEQYQYIIDSGKPIICVESAVFRKNMETNTIPYHRWSWWTYFNDEGDYCNDNSDKTRWEQISEEQQLKIEPWQNNPEGHILNKDNLTTRQMPTLCDGSRIADFILDQAELPKSQSSASARASSS